VKAQRSRDPAGRAAADGRQPLLIGLSGPMGCGKSTVARMLGELGGTVIDADRIARRATEPGARAMSEIRRRFGEDVFAADGTLDRARLAEVVFSDRGALADLESIVHPHVRRMVDSRLVDAARNGVPFVVLEAIKLVEGGLAERCDEVWLVDCARGTQRRRLAERGFRPDDVERRLAAQGPRLTDRLAARLGGRAGIRRISTDGTLEQTRDAVEHALADALAPLVVGDQRT
jgi:dephospho-CoA kinase